MEILSDLHASTFGNEGRQSSSRQSILADEMAKLHDHKVMTGGYNIDIQIYV